MINHEVKIKSCQLIGSRNYFREIALVGNNQNDDMIW